MVDGGYAWWYLDALSDDARHALTVIAFVGSVFSPYYAWARRRGPARAEAHCAFNVALGGPAARWTLTERGAAAVDRGPRHLAVGPSSAVWDDEGLLLTLHERSAPWGRRVVGRVRVRAATWLGTAHALDPHGRHLWQPLAPAATVEVAFDRPRLQWRGAGYVDSNRGEAPLERDIAAWQWSRARLRDGSCAVVYDVQPRDAPARTLALRFGPGGAVRPFEPAPRQALPSTRWRLSREVAGAPARVLHTLEDGPFYARSVLGTHWLDEPVTAVHETLSLDRFARGWVQALLPFRMPRRPG